MIEWIVAGALTMAVLAVLNVAPALLLAMWIDSTHAKARRARHT